MHVVSLWTICGGEASKLLEKDVWGRKSFGIFHNNIDDLHQFVNLTLISKTNEISKMGEISISMMIRTAKWVLGKR